jgi:hypothetical protein
MVVGVVLREPSFVLVQHEIVTNTSLYVMASLTILDFTHQKQRLEHE